MEQSSGYVPLSMPAGPVEWPVGSAAVAATRRVWRGPVTAALLALDGQPKSFKLAVAESRQ